MDDTRSEQADQALRRYVRGARTLLDIGIEFAHLREERALSLEDLARRARMPLEAVQAIESGARLPSSDEFARLAAGLDLTEGRLALILRPVLRHGGSDIGTLG